MVQSRSLADVIIVGLTIPRLFEQNKYIKSNERGCISAFWDRERMRRVKVCHLAVLQVLTVLVLERGSCRRIACAFCFTRGTALSSTHQPSMSCCRSKKMLRGNATRHEAWCPCSCSVGRTHWPNRMCGRRNGPPLCLLMLAVDSSLDTALIYQTAWCLGPWDYYGTLPHCDEVTSNDGHLCFEDAVSQPCDSGTRSTYCGLLSNAELGSRLIPLLRFRNICCPFRPTSCQARQNQACGTSLQLAFVVFSNANCKTSVERALCRATAQCTR